MKRRASCSSRTRGAATWEIARPSILPRRVLLAPSAAGGCCTRGDLSPAFGGSLASDYRPSMSGAVSWPLVGVAVHPTDAGRGQGGESPGETPTGAALVPGAATESGPDNPSNSRWALATCATRVSPDRVSVGGGPQTGRPDLPTTPWLVARLGVMWLHPPVVSHSGPVDGGWAICSAEAQVPGRRVRPGFAGTRPAPNLEAARQEREWPSVSGNGHARPAAWIATEVYPGRLEAALPWASAGRECEVEAAEVKGRLVATSSWSCPR